MDATASARTSEASSAAGTSDGDHQPQGSRSQRSHRKGSKATGPSQKQKEVGKGQDKKNPRIEDDAATLMPRKVKGTGDGEAPVSGKKPQKTVFKKKERQEPQPSADREQPRDGKNPKKNASNADQTPKEATQGDDATLSSSPRAGGEKVNEQKKENQDGEPEEPKSAATGTSDCKEKQSRRKKDKEHEEAPQIDYSVDLVTTRDYRETAWFAASEGDLRFAQWLFGRCQGMMDLKTVDTVPVLRRVHQLYRLEKRIQQELLNRSKQMVHSEGGEEDGEEEEDNSEHPDAEGEVTGGISTGSETLWTVAAIVEDVRPVLRISRHELYKQELESSASSKSSPKRSLERTLVSELIENTTELLLNRASFEEIPVLESWMDFLNEDIDGLKQDVQIGHADRTPGSDEPPPEEGEVADEAVAAKDANDDAKSSKREQKRQQKRQRGRKDVEGMACEQLGVCIEFLKECQKVADGCQQDLGQPLKPTDSPIADLLVSELQRIYSEIRINESDECRRLQLTHDLQQMFRRKVDKWRMCNLILFGSSLSHYGSTNSDLDMCLIVNPSMTKNENADSVSSRQLRSMLNGKSSSSSHSDDELDMVALQGLLFQVKKSIEKITMLYRGLENATNPSRGQEKQMQQLRFFHTHLLMLRDAIADRVVASGKDDGGESAAAAAKAAAMRIKELVARNRRQSDDLFRVKAMLERSGCQIRMVISGARIPIIRFHHVPTKLDCDLCFENVLATWNTFLLRAYASFDERARILGLAIKHWAKQRAINDASIGFLSSYSFVLLSVYFLQVAARVLPNLQDPLLLATANVTPEYFNGIDISFCGDRDAALWFHAKRTSAESSSYSVATLLLGFFEFYATKFDFAKRVVAIRNPDDVLDKRAKWGVQKAKAWRISIQDPLETGRDLGCVLQFKCQEKILQEFKRAHEMLKDGKSFAEVAASAPPQQRPAANKKDERDEKSQQKKNENAVYVLTIWSQDARLSKAEIQRLFKSVDASLRVGKIDKLAKSTTHAGGPQQRAITKWHVELVGKGGGGAAECPRVLQLKSRVDFVVKDEGERGSRSVMWLHHHAVFAHEPCSKCLSPAHAVDACTAAGGGELPTNAHVLTVLLTAQQKLRAASATKRNEQLPANSRANGLKENKEGVVPGHMKQGGAEGKEHSASSTQQNNGKKQQHVRRERRAGSGEVKHKRDNSNVSTKTPGAVGRGKEDGTSGKAR